MKKTVITIAIIAASAQTAFANPPPREVSEPRGMLKVEGSNTGVYHADDQSNKKALLDKTAAIRKEINESKQFSTAAKNVQVITLDNGAVVLKGPVRSVAEKNAIESIAKKRSDSNQVISQLEVSPK